jgi:hypothetical protein
VLRLWDNEIDTEGAISIATALHSNSTLRLLSLDHNKIGPIGGAQLAFSFSLNSTLTELTLQGNDIDVWDLDSIEEGRHRNLFNLHKRASTLLELLSNLLDFQTLI